MRLREISKMGTANDGRRTIFESVVSPELIHALRDWQQATSLGVLIGGLGLSYHVRPRQTQDIDFLMLQDIPETVPGFKRTRPHAFQHNRTHAEIEIVTPELVKVPREVVHYRDGNGERWYSCCHGSRAGRLETVPAVVAGSG